MPKPSSAASVRIGARIAEARRRIGISARTLAACADLDVTHLQRLEKGIGNPTVLTLVQVAVALEIDLGEIMSGLDASDLPDGRSPLGHSRRDELSRYSTAWS